MRKGFLVVFACLAAVLEGLTPTARAAQSAGAVTLTVKFAGNLSTTEQAAVVARHGGTKKASIPSLRLQVVTVPETDLPLALSDYRNDPQVESVEENRTRKAQALPNDLDYGVQWSLPKIGWDTVYGTLATKKTATVAILDTGIQSSHPDLRGIVASGTSILDGGNGLTDPSGHGTNMAGIVAAATNNGRGIAGIAYKGVKIVPVTVLDATGAGYDSDIISGIVWAADNGADVILMAFSSSGFSQHLQDAIDYAWSKGVVLVAATGNDGLATATFPAGSRGVIGVSATDQNDLLASQSNSGSEVFLAAPGTDIYTTGLQGGYVYVSGTSASAAAVAGVAAMMRSVDPTLGNGAIVGRLAQSAAQIGADDPDRATKFGNGRLDMASALQSRSGVSIQPAGVAPETAPANVAKYVAAANAVTSWYHAPSGTTGPYAVTNTAFACGSGTSRLLVAVVTAESSAGAWSVTATKGSGVNFTTAVENPNSATHGVWIGYLTEAQIAGNSSDITITRSGGNAWTRSDVYLACYDGINQQQPIVSGGIGENATDTAATSWSFNNIAAVNSGEVIYAAAINNSAASGGGFTPSSGYTEAWDVNNGNAYQSTVGYKNISATGSESGTISWASNTYAAAVVSLNPANGTTTTPVTVLDAWPAAPQLTSTSTSVVTPITTNFTVSSGSNRLLVVAIAVGNNRNKTHSFTVTYGGRTLTQAAAYTTSSSRSTWIGYLKEADIQAAVGTTLSVLVSGQHTGTAVYIASYANVNQSQPVLDNGSYSDTTTPFTLGPLTKAYNGYGIYNWGGTTARTRSSDTESYTEASDLTTAVGNLASYGIASTFFTSSGVSGPAVTWSGTPAAALSFVTLNPPPGTALADQTITVTAAAPASAVYGSTFTVAATASSGLPVTIGGTGSCSGSGTNGTAVITMVAGDGTACTVSYQQPGNGAYNPAPAVQSTYTVATPITLTVTNATVSNRVYDGTTTATVTGTGTLTGVINGDIVSLTGTPSGVFTDKNVGTGKTVTVTGLAISTDAIASPDGDNYTLGTVTGTANITSRPITVTATTNSKVYDGTTTAAAIPTISSGSLATGDTGTFTEAYSTKTVGNNKQLIPSGMVSDGNGGANYTITFSNSNGGVITAKGLTVTGYSAASKGYDGTTSATLSGSGTLVGVASGDTVSLTGTATGAFADKNVGAGKTVTISGLSLTGTDAGNYTLTAPTATANITSRAITITAAANTKAYDGTTTAAAVPTVTSGSLATGDTATYSETYSDKAVGTGKTLVPTATINDGNGGGNYTVTPVNSTSGVITGKSLTVSGLTAANKTYDGTTTATLSGTATLVGVSSGDTVTLTGTASGAFANKNVGSGKTVSISGLSLTGADAGNYTLTAPTTTANITTRAITVTAATNSKIYDGTTSAAAVPTITSGSLASGDTAVLTETYSSLTVGTGKTLVPSGTVSDGNGGANYAVTLVNNTTGVITAKTLTVSGYSAADKQYDGTTAATLSGTGALVGVISGDTVSLNGTASGAFADRNVGTGKIVNISGLSLKGNDAGNYTLGSPTVTAAISAKPLTVTAQAKTKSYGASDPVLTYSYSGLVNGDTGSVFSGSLTRAAGEAIGSYAIGQGTLSAGSNYAISFTGANLTISAATLTVTAQAKTKSYGTSDPVLTYSYSGLVNGDTGSVFSGSLTRAAGEAIGSYAIGQGTLSAGGNYAVSFTGANLTIVPQTVVPVVTAASKVYDGTVAATINGRSLSGVIGADDVSLAGGSATFADPDVGVGKVVTVTGLYLSGSAVGNYQLASSTATATADITDTAPVISATSPATGSFVNTAAVGYTLDRTVINGTGAVTFTRTGGSDDPGSPRSYAMTAADMTAGSHSINTGLALVNGAIYTVTFAVADGAGYAATPVANTDVAYDAAAAAVTLTTPAAGSTVNNATVGYSLSKSVVSGSIVYTRTGGSVDSTTHSYPLSGAELTAGDHTVATGLALVDGAVYTVSVENVVDAQTNLSPVVSHDNVTYDSTSVAISATAPAAGSAVSTATVAYTLSEQAAAGKVTFARSGGAADPASPQTYTLSGAELQSGSHSVDTALPLVEGAIYTVSFDAVDPAGNAATTVSNGSVLVDRTPPQNGSLTATPGDAQVALTWSFSDPVSGIASYKVVYDTTAPADCSAGTQLYSGPATSAPLTGLVNGTSYHFLACATDNAGNVATASASATPIGSQTITLSTAAPAGPVAYGTTFPVAATAPGGVVTISASGGCSVQSGGSGSAVIVMTSGTLACTVSYDAPADAAHTAATTTSVTTAVRGAQTISITTVAPVSKEKDSSFTVAASASSGLAVSYSSGSPTVCTNVGPVFTMVSASGTCVVNFDQGGDGNYAAAPRVTSSVTALPSSSGSGVTYAITATAGRGGVISPAGTVEVPAGGSQTFTFTPNLAGYKVYNVVVDGKSVGVLDSYTFTNVSAPHTITVTFTNATIVTIAASAGTGGSITPSGNYAVISGYAATFTITPDTGYCVADVLVNGSSVGAVTSYKFLSVKTPQSIAASFKTNCP